MFWVPGTCGYYINILESNLSVILALQLYLATTEKQPVIMKIETKHILKKKIFIII